MKIDRHGKAKVLTAEEIQLLFNQGLLTLLDRCLFAICLYTACRINEACTLRRIPDLPTLQSELAAWNTQTNTAATKIDWQFTTQLRAQNSNACIRLSKIKG